MKKYRELTAEAVGLIDDRFIAEAADFSPRRIKLRGLHAGLAAACLIIAVTVGVIAVRAVRAQKADREQAGNVSAVQTESILPRPYELGISANETAVIWPWEYMTEFERYGEAELDGESYCRFSGLARDYAPISDSVIGENLGKCTLKGYDEYTIQDHTAPTHTEQRDAFAVKGADKAMLIAVKLDKGYALYRSADNAFYSIPPYSSTTFGEMASRLGLIGRTEFTHFAEYDGDTLLGDYSVTEGKQLFDMLFESEEIRDAYLGAVGTAEPSGRKLVLFMDCPDYGIDNYVFHIYENGYVSTNFLNYGIEFKIGSESARKIIAFAKEHSSPAGPVSHGNYIIGGRVTEIGDGYVRIDDSVLFKDQSRGMVFTVPTDDLRIRRCMEFSPKPEVGDTVAVLIDHGSVTADGVVSGAYDLVQALLTEEGGLYIPE